MQYVAIEKKLWLFEQQIIVSRLVGKLKNLQKEKKPK
jgi:hypothetical protein